MPFFYLLKSIKTEKEIFYFTLKKMAQVLSERLQKFDAIFQILKEENELAADNILNMHEA